MYNFTNCIVFSKLKFTDFVFDQFLYLFLYVYKLCQLVAYVLAVAPIIWVSRSITTYYSKLLLSHFIMFGNKHILILFLFLSCADDITLSCPCIRSLNLMLEICNNAAEHNLIFNPIRSGLFRSGGGGGALNHSPYDLKNYCVNLHDIIHVHFTRCFRHVPIGIFQKFAILTILQ